MNIKIRKNRMYVLLLAVFVFGLLPSINANEIDDLRRTSKALSAVAKSSVPAVVFIKVEKTIEVGSVMTPGRPFEYNDPFGFFGDEFFDRFFRHRLPSQPRERKQIGQGSGFIIDQQGYILTNNHVVGNADVINVKLSDGRELKAKLIGSDEKSDVAVIKIDEDDLPTIPLGDSDDLEIGELVIAIGNPFGLTESLTLGIVSAKGRSTVGITEYEDFIQTDAAINPGNSGGPLINLQGEVVGINTAIFSQSGGNMGIGFAIPINMVRNIKEQLVKKGKVTRGQLGVIIGDLEKDFAEYFNIDSSKGVVVNDVLKDSPAEKAGIERGDIILEINGRKVEDVGQLRNTVAMASPGTKVKLLVYRNGRKKTVTVKIGELSDSIAQAETSDLSEKLGMSLQEMNEDIRRFYGDSEEKGVIVSRIVPGSHAEMAGIRPGNIILSVNQKEVRSIQDVNSALRESVKTKKVLLLIKAERFTRFVVIPFE